MELDVLLLELVSLFISLPSDPTDHTPENPQISSFLSVTKNPKNKTLFYEETHKKVSVVVSRLSEMFRRSNNLRVNKFSLRHGLDR